MNFVLVYSPLVGPLSLQPTVRALQQAGHHCQLPDAIQGKTLPPWRDWPQRLAEALQSAPGCTVVGHSMGGLLAAALAQRCNARGLICLDAPLPPAGGNVRPAAPAFLTFIRGLQDSRGVLPPWHQWWGKDLLGELGLPAPLAAEFAAQVPRLSSSWFEDHFEMPAWDVSRRGYLRTSGAYDSEAAQAGADGWCVKQLQGTHLHPLGAPAATAAALVELADNMYGEK